MSQVGNLSAPEQAKVDAKLAELQQKTGRSWACEITKQLQSDDGLGLLEIAVDGHISRPVIVDETNNPADHICREIDRVYEAR